MTASWPILWCRAFIPVLETVPNGLNIAQQIRCKISTTGTGDSLIAIETKNKTAAEALLVATEEGMEIFQKMQDQAAKNVLETP